MEPTDISGSESRLSERFDVLVARAERVAARTDPFQIAAPDRAGGTGRGICLASDEPIAVAMRNLVASRL